MATVLISETMAPASTDPPVNDQPKYVGDGLDPGVAAGVGVACGIILIALILLVIYCCVRGRNYPTKEDHHTVGSTTAASSVYTSGTSQNLFTQGSTHHQKGNKKYGSMEDIKSTTSSQERANGAYVNPAYTRESGERRYERQTSFGRSHDKGGFANEAYDMKENTYIESGEEPWEERATPNASGNKRLSRKDSEQKNVRPTKSALKKNQTIEMGAQPVNGILKIRAHSPNRSQTSSTDASLDANAMIYGYSHLGKDQPNIKHKPIIERKRSRSGTRSHRSGSSAGHSRRSRSPDLKKVKNSRMYGEVFIDDRSHRSRSSGRRAHSDSSRKSRSERTSDSVDSGSSTASQSRKVSMNPGGKRVHIKGEETDI